MWKQEETEKLLKKIPVVMFSAVDQGYTVKTCLLDRAVDYFIKDLPQNKQYPQRACLKLVEIMKKAMNESRRWIFADVLEKSEQIIPKKVRTQIVGDLDDAVRYLFYKPKLAFFCIGSAYETFSNTYSPQSALDNYFHYLGKKLRDIIAHNLFGNEPGYNSLDAEISFWTLITLCHLVKGEGQTVPLEVNDYCTKLQSLVYSSNEYLALFSAICVRLALIQKEKTDDNPDDRI